jgi:hypothetical protein
MGEKGKKLNSMQDGIIFLPSQDSGSDSNSLDVGDSGWASEKTDISRERGLQSWLTLLAFE